MTQQHESRFPELDSTRTEANCPGHQIISEHGTIEPFVDEMDTWVSIPVRVAVNAGAGLCIEVGPYTLGRQEIDRLRAAIFDYDVCRASERPA
jgi:hypothetical protein